jgi:hypothetical protein
MTNGEARATVAKGIFPRAEAVVGLWIGRFAGALAFLGGIVLTLVTITAVVSILGRYASRTRWPIFDGLGPIPGDFELVSMGAGFAVFSFLAWCQYKRGHVTVDIFVSWMGPRALAGLSTFTNLVLTGVVVLIAWQHGLGLYDRMRFRETTTILQIPVWWGYAGGLVGLWSFALVSAYTVWRSLNEALGAGEPDGDEA